MSIWSILDWVTDVIDFVSQSRSSLSSWRFYVCLLASIALVVVVEANLQHEPTKVIVGTFIVIVGFLIGRRWEKHSG